ncbi:MAG: ATP-binding protein [Akkermansiaceae bacterium]|jgi:signal transduction histidine kinase|nr:ATP-binding protein [Akkermansiaceae bacterium]MDP4648094.1 ATP-binding protein [Akkermansiaceae bacterium]MDP4720824.1 ATP-binding protein [Akkermansiaceae bacterium]MDP4780636.1 ATP-binding protein [Akkermansiaceae bacterium]MDP4848482.1 ATP-binding protein [Akkermansiaceae bacterium]
MVNAPTVFLMTLLLAFQGVFAETGNGVSEYEGQTLEQIEFKLEQIDRELDGLARFTLRSGLGNIGWISKRDHRPNNKQWVEITLAQEAEIDRIVLAPVIWNDAMKGPQADALPEAFDIIVGTGAEDEGRVIASLGAEDEFLPRIAPLVIRIPPTKATWVRIQPSRLSADARTGNYQFSLSEIMVFSGERNVALGCQVRVSSNIGGWGAAGIYKEALVDGFTPYLMDASTGEDSNAFKVFFNEGQRFSAVIDLGEEVPVDEIRLHTADASEYVPQLVPGDFGLPADLLIEGANLPNFSDATPLVAYQKGSLYQLGPILSWYLPETSCRYIRLSAPEGYEIPESDMQPFCVILAEIEVVSKGRNVAKGKAPKIPRKPGIALLFPSELTDGRNHFGDILSTSEWMDQLARRHDLEAERPGVAAALQLRYEQQKAKLIRISWIAAIFGAGIIFTMMIGRMLRMRAIEKLRERLAADMHDELGANIHTIGLLSDSANASRESEEEWEMLHRRIRALTEQTGRAVRRCSKVVDDAANYTDLIEDMKRTARRITGQFEHSISIEGEEYLGRFSSQTLLDTYLFYKECLVNIYRHSHATRFQTHMIAAQKEIILTVSDNGQGLPEGLAGDAPPSLKRRARLLRGKLSIEKREEGGTRLVLKVRNRKWWQGKGGISSESKVAFGSLSQTETP